jgi:hypothetical protein
MGGNSFGWALDMLRAGRRVRRGGWDGEDEILLHVPDAHSKMTRGYLVIETVTDDRYPWQPSQVDILAEDWEASPA